MTVTNLLYAALVVAWLLIPIIIAVYYFQVVPERYREIRDRFLNQGGKPEDSAGWYYVILHRPGQTPAEPEAEIELNFWSFHDWKRYALGVLIVMVLSGLMLWFTGQWIRQTLQLTGPGEGAATEFSRIPAPFLMALWGGFVWSLYEIWGRRKTGDLTPVEVMDAALRLVAAIPIGYAFSLLSFDKVPGLLAFAASAFPIREMRQFLRRAALQRSGESHEASVSMKSRGHLSEFTTGLGNDTLVRLEELNIETYLDLAYTDPIQLMVKTGVPIQLVLSWVDQSLLAVYASPHKATLEKLGMPCALDVREFYEKHVFDSAAKQERDWRNSQAVKDLALKLEIPLEILPQLLRSVSTDPHVEFLARAWALKP